MLAVNPIPRHLSAGGFMNSRMVEGMAAIGSQWFLILPASSSSFRASAMWDNNSRIIDTQDSLAASLVTQQNRDDLVDLSLWLLVDVGSESDAAALRCRRVHEFPDGREDGGDRLVMVLELAFEFVELAGESGVRGEQVPQLHEGAHDVDAHGDGARGIKDVGGLDRAMLGEGIGPIFDVLAASTVQGRNLRP